MFFSRSFQLWIYIYLPTYLPTYLPICLSISLPTHLPILHVYTVYLSIDLSIQRICPSINTTRFRREGLKTPKLWRFRPLPFADKPAALFLLVDGLRNASASEWCAKRFHTHLLPRLSAPWLIKLVRTYPPTITDPLFTPGHTKVLFLKMMFIQFFRFLEGGSFKQLFLQ